VLRINQEKVSHDLLSSASVLFQALGQYTHNTHSHTKTHETYKI